MKKNTTFKDFFKLTMKEISLKEMLANAIHFGHKVSRWNPKMKPYIHGKSGGVHIFNLHKTAEGLKNASEFLMRAASQHKSILIVSTKPQTKDLFEEFQKETDVQIVVNKWIGGLLTNISTMTKRIRRLKDINEMKQTGEIEKFTKKEQSKIKKEGDKLEIAFGGILKLYKVPDILFVVDGKRDENALREAKKLGITIVGICDSNANPDYYDYLIPANDDAISSLAYILDFIFESIKAGKSSQKSRRA